MTLSNLQIIKHVGRYGTYFFAHEYDLEEEELRLKYPVGKIINYGATDIEVIKVNFYPNSEDKKGLVVFKMLCEVVVLPIKKMP
jgi:hypothetical protein